MPPPLSPDAARSSVGWRAALVLGLGVALAHSLWVLGLPFQLDDYFVLRDPAQGLRSEPAADADLPRFMCRLPMWLLWIATTPLAGEPLSPGVYHAVGLALHGFVVALVARCVGRLGPAQAALVAAGATGLAAGALQAVTWTAAWSSLTYTLFGFGALELALGARAPGARVLPRHVGAAACIALAIVSKAPAVVVPAVVLVFLLVTTRDRRSWMRDSATVALGALVGWGARQLYLGASELGYFEQATPGLLDVARRLPLGLQGLGQALMPWNRDPLVADLAPWTARLTGGAVAAPWLAAIVFGLPALAGLVAGRARAAGALLLALGIAILPLAMLYQGSDTNVAARSAYLPLPFALGAWALGVRALGERRRALGALALVVGAAVLVDGSVHVARTERAAAAHTRAALALVDELARRAPDALVLAEVDAGGFAGIPALGEHVRFAARPPFREAPGIEIQPWRDERELLELWRRAPGERPLVVMHTPAGSPVVASRPLPPADTEHVALSARDAGLWQLPEPRPRHASGALEFERDPLQPWRARVTLIGLAGPLAAPLELALPPGGDARVRVELPMDLAALLGPPLTGVRVEGGDVRGVVVARRGAACPAPEIARDTPLAVWPDRAPRVAVALDLERRPVGTFPRLALTFRDATNQRIELFVDGDATGFTLDVLHADAAAPNGAGGLPWSALVTEQLFRLLRDQRYRWLSVEAEITLRTPDGAHVLARSPSVVGRLVDGVAP